MSWCCTKCSAKHTLVSYGCTFILLTLHSLLIYFLSTCFMTYLYLLKYSLSFHLVCLLSDLSVPVSNIPCSWGPGLLPHLWQVLPGLQCSAGICRLDLICRPNHTEDSCQPQQTPQSAQTGQGIHYNPSSFASKDSVHQNKFMKLECLVKLHFWYCTHVCADSQPYPGDAVYGRDSGDHCVPAYPKEPRYLLYLLPAACPCMVLCS